MILLCTAQSLLASTLSTKPGDCRCEQLLEDVNLHMHLENLGVDAYTDNPLKLLGQSKTGGGY